MSLCVVYIPYNKASKAVHLIDRRPYMKEIKQVCMNYHETKRRFRKNKLFQRFSLKVLLGEKKKFGEKWCFGQSVLFLVDIDISVCLFFILQ